MATMPAGLPDWIAKHIDLYLTDPEKAHMWDASAVGIKGSLPTLLLITVGRKSGEEKMLPLLYKQVDDSFVIIASKGGAPAHPSWYFNLKANPDCEIRVGTATHLVHARDAEGAERETLWQQMVELYAPYKDYQGLAGDRIIPVVLLTPR